VKDRIAFINPNLINPAVGIPGVVQFGGFGAGPTPQYTPYVCQCHSPIKPYNKNWEPQVAFAYAATRDNRHPRQLRRDDNARGRNRRSRKRNRRSRQQLRVLLYQRLAGDNQYIAPRLLPQPQHYRRHAEQPLSSGQPSGAGGLLLHPHMDLCEQHR